MASSEFSEAVKSLQRLIVDLDEDDSNSTLNKLFDSCLRAQNEIEVCSLPSNDKEYQDAISICIKALEKCTLMVNELDLFSSNEVFHELQTSSIRYLILPAILGSLTLFLQSEDLSERLKLVEMAEVYFKDFLLRCKNYEVSCESFSDNDEILSNVNDPVSNSSSTRERKIQQFKRKKEIEERMKVLKHALNREDLEENIREYFVLLLEKWIIIALEELRNIKIEKDILKTMPPKKDSTRNNKPEKRPEPLKPMIITKNEIQKKVFGLGYPSMPVLTIEDWYQQRFAKQVEEHKNNRAGKSLQDAAFSGEGLDKEAEEIQKEIDIENDDPTALLKARNWDEWKDDNPRGAGNRYNKG